MDPQQGTPQQDLIIGQTIGNYLVTQKLGEGGMGAVYLAEHPSIGKKVALKVLHSEFSSNEDVVTRFFHEAKAVNNIGHPNIVDITDYGIIQGIGRDHLVYFIMEYLGGITLSKVIANEAPLPPERVFAIGLQVADALAASHRCGIVHRDLKPDNIMLLHRGREQDFVKLLDFGIAKLTGGAAGSSRTRTGIVMGTPAYMSPEQCDGRGNIDHRTDIYALGIVLYQMLVGSVPFKGEGYGEVLVQHLTQAPVPLSQHRMLNPHVEAVVMKALEKRVELRYPTMEEMMRAMSDPVGYVEANGGLAGFTQVQLMPSNAPMPPMRPTHGQLTPGSVPPPMAGMTPTPAPGMMTPGTLTTPTPGIVHQPTPPGIAVPNPTGSVPVQEGKSRLPLIIGGALVVAVAAIIAIVLATRKSEPTSENTASGSDTASGSSAASGSSVVAAGTGSAGSAKVTPGSGSSAPMLSGSGSGSGSAAPAGSGSQVTTPPVDDKVVQVTLTTKPPGAKIIVNGQEIAQKTPETFTLQKNTSTVRVVLHLSGYEDWVLDLKPDSKIDLEKTLEKKKAVPVGKGSNTPPVGKGSNTPPVGKGSGSGTGKGSGKGNDTTLIKPGD